MRHSLKTQAFRNLFLYGVACLLLVPVVLPAQTLKERVYVYGTAGGGPGIPYTYFADLNVLFLRHHQVSVGYGAFLKRAPDAPRINSLFGSSYPHLVLDGFTASYSYILYPKGKTGEMLRFPVGVQLLTGIYSYPANYHESPYWLGPNYLYDEIAEPSMAVALRGGGEWTPSRAFGLCFGGYVLMGKLSGGGVYAGLMLGYVSSRSKAIRRAKRQ